MKSEDRRRIYTGALRVVVDASRPQNTVGVLSQRVAVLHYRMPKDYIFMGYDTSQFQVGAPDSPSRARERAELLLQNAEEQDRLWSTLTLKTLLASLMTGTG
jgi:hypothetical protein